GLDVADDELESTALMGAVPDEEELPDEDTAARAGPWPPRRPRLPGLQELPRRQDPPHSLPPTAGPRRRSIQLPPPLTRLTEPTPPTGRGRAATPSRRRRRPPRSTPRRRRTPWSTICSPTGGAPPARSPATSTSPGRRPRA